MDDANRPDFVGVVREQQHTGNHDPVGTAGNDDAPPAPVLIVTADDAREMGREPDAYAAALTRKLKPYGVMVRLEAKRPGHGALIGVDDPKIEVDIRTAIASVNTEVD